MKKTWLLPFAIAFLCTGCSSQSNTTESAPPKISNQSNLHMQIFSTAKGQHVELKFKMEGNQHVDAVATLTAVASMPGMNPFPISVQKIDNTTYKGTVDLPMTGTWNIIAVCDDGSNQKQFTSTITIQ